jgi:3,4-dihydroxyphenylacetate 2,3-dioxygenase
MGQLALAAKVTHVPSLMLSEAPGSPLRTARASAVNALRELGRRAKARDVTSFIVFDTHWLSVSAITSTPTRTIAAPSRATKRHR